MEPINQVTTQTVKDSLDRLDRIIVDLQTMAENLKKINEAYENNSN